MYDNIKFFIVKLVIALTITFSNTIQADTDKSSFNMSESERLWVQKNPEVSFTGDPNWLPYEAFEKDGKYIGIVADHLKHIEILTGIKFKTIPTSSWSESLDIATEGKVTVISGDVADVLLNKHFNPVDAYSHNPVVIIMSVEQNYVESLDEIKGRKIAIIKDYGYTSDLFKQYPGYDFIKVDNIQQGLTGVAEGRYDAMLATMALASYTIAELGLHNIKVVGKTRVVMDLTMFVDEKQVQLHSILNKALHYISDYHSQEILQGWIKNQYVEKEDYTLTYQVLIVSFILVLISLFWNRRLSKEIELSTKLKIDLQHERDFAASLVNTAPVIVVLLDKEGCIQYLNPYFEDLSGYSLSESKGEEWVTKFVPERDREDLIALLGGAAGKASTRPKISSVIMSTGEEREIEWYTNIIPAHGTINEAVQFVGLDVTERRNAEAALFRSEETMAEAQAIAHIGSWDWDITANELSWSDEIYRIFGVTPQQFKATYDAFLEYIHPDDHEKVTAAVTASVENSEIPYKVEHRVIHPGGQERIVKEQGQVYRNKEGVPIRMIGTVLDVTENKHAEEELKKYREHLEELVQQRTEDMELARNEAEQANAAKSEFLSRMSHELRTPMNAILGFGQLLELSHKGNEEDQENIKEILSAGYHLLELINDVLDITKIEAGKLDMELSHISVTEILQQSLKMIDSQAQQRALTINDTLSDKDYVVVGDFTRAKQAIVNLLTNAVKYNSESGCITIAANIIDNKNLRLLVTDTGNGLTKEDISKLFIPFERLNPSINIEGTGIGLVITKRLVENMNGSIGVESTPGQGSTFWIELPWVDKQDTNSRLA